MASALVSQVRLSAAQLNLTSLHYLPLPGDAAYYAYRYRLGWVTLNTITAAIAAAGRAGSRSVQSHAMMLL